ncbi:MAG: hypothetical protein IJT70_01915 [Clostridia bacterium]|nr:hypothetical protein [Clostridia bacterium]
MITKSPAHPLNEVVVDETVKLRGDERLEYVMYRGEKYGRDSYSVQAIQYKNGNKVCQATASDVSSGYTAAKSIFDAVSCGLVEPYLLCDVVYDLLP